MDRDQSVKEAIKAIPKEQWKPFATREEIMTDREAAETMHATNKGKAAFLLIFIGWKERQMEPFKQDASLPLYYIATNASKGGNKEVVLHQNQR